MATCGMLILIGWLNARVMTEVRRKEQGTRILFYKQLFYLSCNSKNKIKSITNHEKISSNLVASANGSMR